MKDSSWHTLDNGYDFRQEFTSRSGHKYQFKNTNSGEVITFRILPNSSLRHGAKDSLTIYDGKNKTFTALGFGMNGSLESRVVTDYETRQGDVQDTRITEAELGLLKPIYNSDNELLAPLKKKLAYHEEAKHKPLAYLSDIVGWY